MAALSKEKLTSRPCARPGLLESRMAIMGDHGVGSINQNGGVHTIDPRGRAKTTCEYILLDNDIESISSEVKYFRMDGEDFVFRMTTKYKTKQTGIFAEGGGIKCMVHKIAALDEEDMTWKTLINKIVELDESESLVYDVELVMSAGGGCVLKTTTTECPLGRGEAKEKEE